MSNHRIRPKHSKAPRRGDWCAFWPVWALCGGLMLLSVIALASVYIADRPQKSDIPVVAMSKDQDLHLDAAKLSPRQLHLFEVSASGQKAKIVVEMTDDKTVHVALASCRTCYRSHNRHYAKNGQMMCGECNSQMNFEVKDRKAGTTGCALVEIPHAETSSNITVLTRDVLAVAAQQPQ